MKKTLGVLPLGLLLISVFSLSNTFAQDVQQWRLPEGAKARLGKGGIREVQYSPDGRYLAVASSIGIWLYDAQTGEAFDLLTGYTGLIYSVTFSPDGSTLASGCWDGTVRLWDVLTGRPLRPFTGHTADVYSVTFSPDGLTLASGSDDATIRLWDVPTGKPLHIFTGHKGWVRSVAFQSEWEHTGERRAG